MISGMAQSPKFDAEALKARFNPEGSMLRRQQMKMLEMVAELDRLCRKYDSMEGRFSGLSATMVSSPGTTTSTWGCSVKTTSG